MPVLSHNTIQLNKTTTYDISRHWYDVEKKDQHQYRDIEIVNDKCTECREN